MSAEHEGPPYERPLYCTGGLHRHGRRVLVPRSARQSEIPHSRGARPSRRASDDASAPEECIAVAFLGDHDPTLRVTRQASERLAEQRANAKISGRHRRRANDDEQCADARTAERKDRTGSTQCSHPGLTEQIEVCADRLRLANLPEEVDVVRRAVRWSPWSFGEAYLETSRRADTGLQEVAR
jgi:hypothetical protein